MKINEIKAKSILTKSKLSTDYVVNPYVGCMHGCKYCYARFMKKFSNHMNEKWGSFVDAKANAVQLVPSNPRLYQKKILMSSVTDPYQPCERRFKLTRKIIEKLVAFQPELQIITKSDLVLRDIDLILKFKCACVAISLGILDEDYSRQLEPLASSPLRRIQVLKKLSSSGVKTIVFVSPIVPGISNWKKIIEETMPYADEYWFENLNFYFSIQKNIYGFLEKNQPELVKKYREIYFAESKYWEKIEKEICEFCRERKLNYRIFFHHSKR